MVRGSILIHGVGLSHRWCRVGDGSCTRGGSYTEKDRRKIGLVIASHYIVATRRYAHVP